MLGAERDFIFLLWSRNFMPPAVALAGETSSAARTDNYLGWRSRWGLEHGNQLVSSARARRHGPRAD